MGEIVYILCAVTSGLCSWTLFRNYRRNGVRLLKWGAACFGFLALGNIMLFVDMVVILETDLSPLRVLPAVCGYAVLIYGFIGDTV